jgi:hypothetical protein
MAEIVKSNPPDFAKIAEVQGKYGLISDPASIQELCQKYHLHL